MASQPFPQNVVATMFFKTSAEGWSESHVFTFAEGATLAQVLQECVTQGGLCYQRSKILGLGATLDAVRVSRYGVWRDSRFKRFTNDPADKAIVGGWAKQGVNTSDSPYSVTTTRLTAGDGFRKLIYLGGMPSNAQGDFGDPSFDKDFADAFRQYHEYLTGKGTFGSKWGTIVSDKETHTVPQYKVAGGPLRPTYAIDGGKGSLIVNYNDINSDPVAGGKFRMLGVRGNTGVNTRKWNGIFVVTTANPGGKSVTLATKDNPATLPTLDFSNAYVYVPIPKAVPYDDFAYEGKTHRKRGKAFGQLRGRSPVRK